MKKMMIVTGLFILLGSTSFSQQKKFKDLIGRWEIVGEQDAGATLEVIDSSTIILVYMGEKKKITDYKFNFDKFPIWFDFSTEDTASTVSVKSLLQVINDSMIKWQLFVDETRPEYFSATKGDLFYLRKVKPDVGTAVVSN
jgi:hypothetical protein